MNYGFMVTKEGRMHYWELLPAFYVVNGSWREYIKIRIDLGSKFHDNGTIIEPSQVRTVWEEEL